MSWLETVPEAAPDQDWDYYPLVDISKQVSIHGPYLRLTVLYGGEQEQCNVDEKYADLVEPFGLRWQRGEATEVPCFIGDDGRPHFSVKGAIAVKRIKQAVANPVTPLKPTISNRTLVQRIQDEARRLDLSTTQLVNRLLRDHYGVT